MEVYGKSGALPEDVKETISTLEKAVTDVEKHIESYLKTSVDEITADLSSEDGARLSVLLAYALNTLFYIYLKTQGVDPADHPVKEEIERVKQYIQKLKELTQPKETPNLVLNKDAANRFIQHALNSAAAGGADKEDGKEEVEQEKEQTEKNKRKAAKSKKEKKEKKTKKSKAKSPKKKLKN